MLFKYKLKYLGLLIPLAFLLGSCNSNALLNKSVRVDGQWYKDDAATFETIVKDSLQNFDFYLNVRHNVDYRYSNLYLFMQTLFPNGNSSRDTLEIVLATPGGKWLGKGWGDIREDHVLLRKNLRFPLKGKYRFSIWQAMRQDTLTGIQDIGIEIVPVE